MTESDFSNPILTDTISTSRLTNAVIITMGVIATIIIGIVPIFVAGMADELNLGNEAMGVLASADMLGSTVASLICLSIQSRVSWRWILYGALVLAVVGNCLSSLADSYPILLLCRVVAGFGNGFIIALVFIGLCHSSHPDRSFGFYTFGQIALQTILLSTLPRLIEMTSISSIYFLLAGLSFVSVFLVRYFPVGLPKASEVSREASQGKTTLPILPLLGLTIYFLSVAALWAYLEPIGRGFSLDMLEVGEALGMASLIAMLGPVAVILINTRVNRLLCLGFAIVLHLVSALILIYGTGYTMYFVAASLFAFALNYSFPYQMGILSTFDDDGSVAIFALVLQLASFALGPLLASLILFGGYGLLLWSCQLFFVLAFLAYRVSVRRSTAQVDAAC